MSSPPRTKRDVPPRLPSKKQRSQSLTPSQQQQTQIQRNFINSVSSAEKYSASVDELRKGDENQEPNCQIIKDERATSGDGIINGNHPSSRPPSGLKFATNSLPRSEPSPNPKNRAPVPVRTSR